MSRFRVLATKPLFMLAVILPTALIVEFAILEAGIGISLPSDRGSAISGYEVREKGKEVHFITRNKRFGIVDLWSKNGSAVEALVLRESVVTDRQCSRKLPQNHQLRNHRSRRGDLCLQNGVEAGVPYLQIEILYQLWTTCHRSMARGLGGYPS